MGWRLLLGSAPSSASLVMPDLIGHDLPFVLPDHPFAMPDHPSAMLDHPFVMPDLIGHPRLPVKPAMTRRHAVNDDYL